MLYLHANLQPFFKNTADIFSSIMALRGTVYRQLEGRCTQRIVLGDQAYFIKQHRGVGWKEIIKNLLQLRLPILSAQTEWRAIEALHRLQIPTLEVVAYGRRGYNPAKINSFLITRELPDHISLDAVAMTWQKKPPLFCDKKNLIQMLARIAYTLHDNGINHRDFYLCHFLQDKKQAEIIYLIDLHRAGMRRHTPARWIIKDLAGLYFSSKEYGLTKRDFYRFIKVYRRKRLKEIINKEPDFWQKVKTRGDELYRKHQK